MVKASIKQTSCTHLWWETSDHMITSICGSRKIFRDFFPPSGLRGGRARWRTLISFSTSPHPSLPQFLLLCCVRQTAKVSTLSERTLKQLEVLSVNSVVNEENKHIFKKTTTLNPNMKNRTTSCLSLKSVNGSVCDRGEDRP